MKIKTSEATPIQLNWLVATCEGEPPEILTNHTVTESIAGIRRYRITIESAVHDTWQDTYSPSTNWAQGGPIIERQLIQSRIEAPILGLVIWRAFLTDNDNQTFWADHPTLLIAAMRCYVASKLGDEVEIPDELLTSN